ncbi:MAG: hypothetical protein JSV85_03535 [Candidatus Bathyarchaeota archaeon]|nr:MAG: hypothetical protein JSV85_03535 [Candidatus Bathyarchaeota archaeon]
MTARQKGALWKRSLPYIAALAMIAYILLICVVLTKPPEFIIGATSSSLKIEPGEVDQVRYLPGTGAPAGSQQPGTPIDTSPNTFAFKVTTDILRVGAVGIRLTSPVNSTKFSKFWITAQKWDQTASAWKDETLYTSLGSTPKLYIDGQKNPLDIGYINHDASTTGYYLIKLTCLSDTSTQVTITFQYTLHSQPSPYFLPGIAAPALVICVWLLYPALRHYATAV